MMNVETMYNNSEEELYRLAAEMEDDSEMYDESYNDDHYNDNDNDNDNDNVVNVHPAPQPAPLPVQIIKEPQDPSMLITEDERNFALQIRRAVEECDELKPLTDFEYAQYSIISGGNMPDALNRIYGMQLFRDEYRINNSVEQAMTAYREHFQQFPGYILHIDYDEATQEPICVLDLGPFQPNKTLAMTPGKHPDFNWNVDATRNYYQTFVVTPSLSAIRQGVFMIIDCQEIGWENFTIEYSQRLHSELWGHQPVKFKNLLCYNTGSVANVCWNMIKHLMDTNMRETLQLGCQLAEMEGAQTPQRLAELYLQPTIQAAQQKMLQRIAELIELRNHNEATFRL